MSDLCVQKAEKNTLKYKVINAINYTIIYFHIYTNNKWS